MKQIAYISTAVELMNDDQLFSILKTARKNNHEFNVTGILLYSGGTFIQALEGSPDNVDHIFKLIEDDQRHKNLVKLIDSPLTERNFPDWSMGFAAVDPEKANDITGFLSSTNDILNSDNNHTTLSILKTFIAANNLVIEN